MPSSQALEICSRSSMANSIISTREGQKGSLVRHFDYLLLVVLLAPRYIKVIFMRQIVFSMRVIRASLFMMLLFAHVHMHLFVFPMEATTL